MEEEEEEKEEEEEEARNYKRNKRPQENPGFSKQTKTFAFLASGTQLCWRFLYSSFLFLAQQSVRCGVSIRKKRRRKREKKGLLAVAAPLSLSRYIGGAIEQHDLSLLSTSSSLPTQPPPPPPQRSNPNQHFLFLSILPFFFFCYRTPLFLAHSHAPCLVQGTPIYL